MKYADAVNRLATLPARLPAAPAALIPVRTATGGARGEPIPWDPLGSRPAAVLVLVVPGPDAPDGPDGGDGRVVLIERTDRGGYHSGEVSFPGGSAEPVDRDDVATALREAAEEVGLDQVRAKVRVVGLLERFVIPVSGFKVTPVLAIAGRRPVLRRQPAEVARIIEAPLASFLPGAPIEMVERDVRGWHLRYGAYPVDGLLVWGATARVLGQLGAFLAG